SPRRGARSCRDARGRPSSRLNTCVKLPRTQTKSPDDVAELALDLPLQVAVVGVEQVLEDPQVGLAGPAQGDLLRTGTPVPRDQEDPLEHQGLGRVEATPLALQALGQKRSETRPLQGGADVSRKAHSGGSDVGWLPWMSGVLVRLTGWGGSVVDNTP